MEYPWSHLCFCFYNILYYTVGTTDRGHHYGKAGYNTVEYITLFFLLIGSQLKAKISQFYSSMVSGQALEQ